jgi:hypothetical protein
VVNKSAKTWWHTGRQLGTLNAAKQSGLISTQRVGEFAHRQIPTPTLNF